jgi:hypothetical protein
MTGQSTSRALPPRSAIPQAAPASVPARSGIGKATERLLTQLALHDVAKRDGQVVAPTPVAQQSGEAEILVAADLAARRGDGTLEITDAGRAHLARLACARAGSPVDPFLGQHIGLARDQVETADGQAAITVDATESPLAWLARRKGRDGRALIEPLQLQAGERLRADVTLAHILPRITANWTSSVARARRSDGGGLNFTEAAIAARQRVNHALAALGPEFSGLVLDVCCFLKGLEDVERERRWPLRSAKVVLQLGLDRLARHYGFATEARGKARVPMRNWRPPDAASAVVD